METKVIITGNGYTALVPNGSFPPQHRSLTSPAWLNICSSCARLGAVPGTGDDGEINTNMNQTPRTFTDKHTHRLPCRGTGRDTGRAAPHGLCQGCRRLRFPSRLYYYYWVYFYIELPTKCKDLLSGIVFT